MLKMRSNDKRPRRVRRPSLTERLCALRAVERHVGAPFAAKPHAMALVYPNTYHVGMSSLGFQTLLARVNALPDVCAERVFWDVHHPDEVDAHRRRPHNDNRLLDYAGPADADAAAAPADWPGEEPLSVETLRPLSAFPVIAFSVAFEMDYLHLLDMLVRAGLSPWAARRGPHDPLIVAGGACVTMNRLPIYDLVDVVAHGDGETTVEGLARVLRDVGPGRDRLREALRDMPGMEITQPRDPDDRVYPPVPAPPPRVTLADQLQTFATSSGILTPHTEFADRGLIEISRGCPYQCTFCIMGYQPYRYRWRSPQAIEEMARTFLPHTRRVGLVASAVGIHKQIEEICERLLKLEMDISFSSLRVEDVKPMMVEALLAGGQRTLTIAPEAGNEALRRRMKKNLSDEQIERFVHDCVTRGMRNVKLYYMVGLGGETDDDVVSIADFTRRLHATQVDASRAHGRIGHLALNVGVFVPKPGTPLVESGFVGVPEARRRLRLLQRALKGIPNLKVHFANPHHAAAQTLLSCGDRAAADLLWWTWRHARGNWRKAVRHANETHSAVQ